MSCVDRKATLLHGALSVCKALNYAQTLKHMQWQRPKANNHDARLGWTPNTAACHGDTAWPAVRAVQASQA